MLNIITYSIVIFISFIFIAKLAFWLARDM